MKPREQISADKLRGGFYTPDGVADLCLERAHQLLQGRPARRVLEPSCGDGAMIRALGRSELRSEVEHVEAIELIADQAQLAAQAVVQAGFAGHARAASALDGSALGGVDLTIGNPPYVRYHFVSEADRVGIAALGERTGISFAGVTNLWASVMVSALDRLKPGGVGSFVVPTECMVGVSAGAVREWLMTNFERITLDLLPAGSFPGVMQEVLILGARRRTRPGETTLHIIDSAHGETIEREHTVTPSRANWTRYLLDEDQVAALERVERLPQARPVSSLARFEVGTLTGANSFFLVSDQALQDHQLTPWARPMLMRMRSVGGLIYSDADRAAAAASGEVTWLIDFSRHDPLASEAGQRYLEIGLAEQIDQRYKCRTRRVWYEVPAINTGRMLFSKRSHDHPRLVLNEREEITTDTLYRGRMIDPELTAQDLVSLFHTPYTMLLAEMEGRSMGGGVLELVPSELNALRTLAVAGAGADLAQLDEHVRSGADPIHEASQLACRLIPELDPQDLRRLDTARLALRARRMARARVNRTS